MGGSTRAKCSGSTVQHLKRGVEGDKIRGGKEGGDGYRSLPLSLSVLSLSLSLSFALGVVVVGTGSMTPELEM